MVEGSSPTELLRRFQEIQSRRAALYTRFDAGFRRYLQSRQQGIYRRLLAELTSEFNDCSREVIAVEAALRDGRGRPDLAALLRGVQEQEREKLRLTLALQALKGAYERREFSWQREEEEGAAARPTTTASPATGGVGVSLTRGHTQAVAAAAHEHMHAHAGSAPHACGCGPPPQEPTEAEYSGAVGEAIRSLQEVVTAINDLLEEVRYEVEEEEEEPALRLEEEEPALPEGGAGGGIAAGTANGVGGK